MVEAASTCSLDQGFGSRLALPLQLRVYAAFLFAWCRILLKVLFNASRRAGFPECPREPRALQFCAVPSSNGRRRLDPPPLLVSRLHPVGVLSDHNRVLIGHWTIGLRSISNEEPQYQELLEILRTLPLKPTLRKLSYIGFLLWNSARNGSPDCDYQVLPEMAYGSPLKARILEMKSLYSPAMFFSDEQIRALIYLTSCVGAHEQRPFTSDDSHALLHAGLITNSLLEAEFEQRDRALDVAIFAKLMSRELPLSPRVPALTWARYYDFLTSHERCALDVPLLQRFEQHTGFTLSRYCAIGWMLWRTFAEMSDRSYIASAVPAVPKNSPAFGGDAERWLGAHCLRPSEQPPEGLPLGVQDWLHVVSRPFVELDASYCSASMFCLEDRLGQGLLHTAISACKTDEEFPFWLTSDFGSFLEERVRQQLISSSSPDVTICGDEPMGGRKTSDVIVRMGDTVFLAEIVSSRLTPQLAVSGMELTDFARSFYSVITEKIDQLRKNVRWLTEGLYHQHGIFEPGYSPARIVPVLATLYDATRLPSFMRMVEGPTLRDINSACTDVALVSVDDIESLCLAGHANKLWSYIERYTADAPHASFGNFVAAQGSFVSDLYASDATHELIRRIENLMREELRAQD